MITVTTSTGVTATVVLEQSVDGVTFERFYGSLSADISAHVWRHVSVRCQARWTRASRGWRKHVRRQKAAARRRGA